MITKKDIGKLIEINGNRDDSAVGILIKVELGLLIVKIILKSAKFEIWNPNRVIITMFQKNSLFNPKILE